MAGKFKQDGTAAEGRIQSGGSVGGPPAPDERLYKVLDSLKIVADETGKSIPQVAINWLLQKNTVSNIVIGARNENQLIENIGAVDWQLSAAHIKLLDDASETAPIYPHWVGQRRLSVVSL